MFEKLIVCEPEGSDIHNRRSYFMVSSLVVGVLFLASVVFSIYAADYGLGNDSFELSMVVAPPEIAVADPKLLQSHIAANPAQSQSLSPAKPTFVAPLDDPRTTPTTISVVPNSIQTWTSRDPAPAGPETPNGSVRGETDSGTGTVGIGNPPEPTEPDPVIEPPSIKKPAETKPALVRSEGPINGKATYLPKPPYPAAAIALNIQGKVDVQVMIDETGKVVSSNAVSGHPFLRAVAERAAWQAKFSPTYLAKVPVKVTGVIVYNFSR